MRKRLLYLLLLLSPVLTVPAAPPADQWKGFERIHLTIAGHPAWYVRPTHPLPGNPWIWRASFPDWHADMDSLLLIKGCYVAYISIDDQYGSPYAMQVWDRFYQYLVDSARFAPQVALEAVSRGALYAYGWAKRNPDKITCLYAETPVCNIRSWPGGKGQGPGDAAAWRQLLSVYRITEDSALRFADNPMDHLEGLASFKVPLLHIIGIRDSLAPSDENTYPLADRYMRLGGPITIYPVTTGPQELHGHHFPIEHPGKWADWVLGNSYPVRKRLPYGPYLTTRQGLSHSFARFTGYTASGPAPRHTATVAFFGGSITYNPGWRNKTMAWLQERFPETDFHFISAGIPSLGSPAHAFRLQQDVLDSGKVDLLFVEAAVNDRGNGTDSLTQIRSLEGIVRHARRSNPAMDIILMSFADPLKTADYDQGRSPMEIQNQEAVAERYRLPSINLAKEIRDKIENHEFSWEYDFKNLHPSPFGQELYFATIKKLLETSYPNEPSPGLGSPPSTAQSPSTAQPPSTAQQQPLPAPLDAKSFGNGRYYAPEAAQVTRAAQTTQTTQAARAGNDWTSDNDWHPDDGLPIQKGFVHVPVLQATKPGATLSFAFTGTAVGIAVDAGPDAGKIAWSVDGSPDQSVDLFTPWSAGRHLPWYLVLGQGLKNKRHTLKLRIEDNKNKDSKGTACRIIHFLVNQ